MCLFFASCSYHSLSYASPEKLPLPRFVSLRSNKINSHVGPGKTYPIEWVFTRQNMPVEIIAEFDTWRQIKDIDGTLSWVHKSLLSGKRTILIKNRQATLYTSPQKDSPPLAVVHKQVIGKLKNCQKNWCQVTIQNYSGWIQRKHLWGVYDHEEKI